MKNHFRLFSIFLCVILSFSFLSVNSFAADSTNLVDSNLSNWVDANDLYPDYYDDIITGASASGYNWQHVTIYPEYKFALIYDLSDLIIDRPYKFSFDFAILNSSFSVFNVFDVYIGVATLDNSIGLPTGNTEPRVEYVLTSDNYTEFLEDGFSMQFNLSSFVGRPCVYFAFSPKEDGNLSQSTAYFHVRNISLVEVDENAEKLDGILGWLQELWNSITGGFDRVQTKIGEVITNLSGELQSVKEGITTKLGEVITNLSGVLNSVKEGITTKLGEVITGLTGELRFLGDRIINYLLFFDDEVPENPFEGVDSPLDEVQGFFDDLIDYLSNIGDDIETVIDSITGPVTLLDHFTKRFEWLFGIVTFTLMLIVVSRFIGL